MTVVRSFPDEMSTSRMLRPKRWEWLVGVLRRSSLMSCNSKAKRATDLILQSSNSGRHGARAPLPTLVSRNDGTRYGHTGSAMEYFTWLKAKLDSIEAMPSSRVSLFFKNASYDDRSAATTRSR